MASGGAHPPANPAAASGPGALSQRTDGKQPIMALGGGVKYGEQQQFQSDQAGAPMPAASPTPAPAAAPQPQQPPTSFTAPTTRPNEPVTAGANAGPGPDQGALNLPKGDTPAQIKAMYGPILPALVAESQSQYATQAYKDSVTALLALF
jgi:hypothetical protein